MPPQVGALAHVQHFGGEAEMVTVVDVRDGGRLVTVRDAVGTHRDFTLRQATAAFVARDEQYSPRLLL